MCQAIHCRARRVNNLSMSLKRNVVANYLGQGWTALMGLAFLPLIIKFLGADAYGLVGVYAMLQVWFALLDMGMTPTLNREMARYTAGAHTSKSIRDLLRSLEIVCILVAVFIGFTLAYASNFLSTHWLHSEKISTEVVSQAITIMAFVVALRFIEGLYRGALMGLQKQVTVNLVSALMATFRWGGVVGVLMLVQPTINNFFLWQGFVSIITTGLFVIILYHNLPECMRSGKFSWLQIKSVWSFAGGMMAQTLLTLLLMQVDKIILSRQLNLEMFGYYILAGNFANVAGQMVAPITQAYLPRFTTLITKGDTDSLVKTYHQGAQLASITISSTALMLIFFGSDIILLWGGDGVLANNVAPILSVLAFGTMLNCLMHIPYMLTLAYKWPSFFVRVNLVAVIVFVSLMFFITPIYGAIGAGWIWVSLNVGYLLIAAPFIFKRLLVTEMWTWYRVDIFQPVVASALMAVTLYYLNIRFSSGFFELLRILASGMLIAFASILAVSDIRSKLFDFLKSKYFGVHGD